MYALIFALNMPNANNSFVHEKQGKNIAIDVFDFLMSFLIKNGL